MKHLLIHKEVKVNKKQVATLKGGLDNFSAVKMKKWESKAGHGI